MKAELQILFKHVAWEAERENQDADSAQGKEFI